MNFYGSKPIKIEAAGPSPAPTVRSDAVWCDFACFTLKNSPSMGGRPKTVLSVENLARNHEIHEEAAWSRGLKGANFLPLQS